MIKSDQLNIKQQLYINYFSDISKNYDNKMNKKW